MNALLNRIFGLGGGIGFGDEGVHFGLARPIPAWGWVLAVLIAGAFAGWSYWRLAGARGARVALAVVRGLTLLLILTLILGPQLVRPNERVEKDWILVLLDRSGSMAIADAPGSTDPGGPGSVARGRETRDEQLKSAVTAAWPAFAKLAKDRTVVFLGFDSGVYDLKVEEQNGAATGLDVGPATGRRTSIGAALDQALARAAARPLSGIVLVSDGRSVDEPGRNALRRLQSEHVPVYTVALGSADPIADLAVAKAESPALAFINDTVPVNVEIDRLGAAAPTTPAAGVIGGTGKVQLVDKATGLVMDEKPLPTDAAAWQDGRTHVTLTDHPENAGKFTWVVRLVPAGPDLIEQNNTAELAIELVDRPLRVAYFDGYPRWEYRYLKNLLLREKSIHSASMLLASNRQYLQEGDITLDSTPRSPEEWAKFDVIVLGDLAGSMFTREQLEQLREHVAVRGAGLLWIGGPAATPAAWRDTPLADLLPFALGASTSAAESSVRAYDEPVLMFPTPAAKRLDLLQLSDTTDEGWPAKLSDPATGWSALRYAQRIAPEVLKPTAEVLATFARVSSVSSGNPQGMDPTPAVLSMRYGAGRVLYVATDEIWRWRYARGEALPERFWLPFLRLQGRESLARSFRAANLDVTPRRPEVDQPVRVEVQILDQSLLDAAPSTVTVRLRRENDATGGASTLTLAPDPGQTPTTGKPIARSFGTTWLPSEPGKYTLEVVDALLSSAGLTATAEVTLPDDELRHPETDHPLLERLSKATEGRVMSVADLKMLDQPAVLPNREVHITGTPDVQALWDKPLALILLVGLLAMEWVGRRVIRLA